MTHGSIIGIDVHVHYNNDVHVEFHYVPSYNDQNDVFDKGPTDIYTLEVYNLKNHVYSRLQVYYRLESYKIPPHPLSCLFVIVYFFLLLEAMSESTLDKLKKKQEKENLRRKLKQP